MKPLFNFLYFLSYNLQKENVHFYSMAKSREKEITKLIDVVNAGGNQAIRFLS